MNGDDETQPETSSIVARAQAIVSEQSGCTIEEALGILDEVAASTGETVEGVAELVIRGDVRFD